MVARVKSREKHHQSDGSVTVDEESSDEASFADRNNGGCAAGGDSGGGGRPRRGHPPQRVSIEEVSASFFMGFDCSKVKGKPGAGGGICQYLYTARESTYGRK